jgi:UDP-N-acetyl-2-amino-2-deoxyglucuronate dehydrogenase
MNFALVGVGGFIAPRHLDAIHALGHKLIAAYDPNDSVGIMDRYFPDCRFFTKFEKFSEFVNQCRGTQHEIQYVSICSPNDMHASHIQFAMRAGAHAICEKPLVLSTRDLDQLIDMEKKSDRRVFTVLQLRHHGKIQELKSRVASEKRDKPYEVDLTYMTSRGQWYHESWKGDIRRSGGLSSNIGIHFFDMLTWVFGGCRKATLLERTPSRERGQLELAGAKVNWFLSIDRGDLPKSAVEQGKTTFRSITIDGQEFEFSDGFTELHKEVYRSVLAGNGFGVAEARKAIQVVEDLRSNAQLY